MTENNPIQLGRELEATLRRYIKTTLAVSPRQPQARALVEQAIDQQAELLKGPFVEALPDFVKLSESFGHVGMRITEPGDLEGAMQEAFSLKDRFVFLDVVVDPKENVYPMIAAGKGHHEMHLSPERELA